MFSQFINNDKKEEVKSSDKKAQEKVDKDKAPNAGEKPCAEDEPQLLDIEMKPGDYRVQVHILEAKDIKASGKAGGGGFLSNFEGQTADPMVEASVLGQKKLTEYKSGQLSPIFNEMLFFEFKSLSSEDLETAVIQISLLDHDFIGSNNMIGMFTVDLSYVYKMNLNHELHRMWVPVTDTNDETQSINGYIKLTINVLGPGDKPPIHNPMVGLKSKNDNGAPKLFTSGRVKMKGHLIELSIYRAEHLAPLNLISNSVDSYFKASFAGSKAQTKIIKANRNPDFNQKLSLACKIPNMNSQMEIQIWDDEFTQDERLGTHFIKFKEVQNKTDGPRWANLYGPPLQAEGMYADLMTRFGERGSTYRGRFIYSVTTHDQENPKNGTEDLKFSFPSNPSPSIPERGYMLKVALYEGIELPEFDQLCIHVTCGPYEAKSKVVSNENSRAIWNQYIPDLNIRAPESQEDIFDVIIYLAKSQNNADRICFKRIKACDLLDTNGKTFDIENYLFEEDKSIDPLDDEQFPGMVQMRIKLYSTDAEDDFPTDLFKSLDEYTDYLLQIHLYMGRSLPPADETGAADPFIIARCQGKKVKSSIKYETLNPGFFETLEMVVSLPPIGNKNYPQPGISLLLYDDDTYFIGEKKDLLGRVWIDIEKKITQKKSPVDQMLHTVHTTKDAQWYDVIFDATNQKEGAILVGYDVIPLDVKDAFLLEKICIRPKTVKGVLSMAIMGLRDVVPSIDLFPVKKVFCKFDISGDTKDAIVTNKHSVIDGTSNFFEVISVEVDVPLDLNYSPVLTVYVYDQQLGFLNQRIVGVSNIPLEEYCKHLLNRINDTANAFKVNKPLKMLGDGPAKLGKGQQRFQNLNMKDLMANRLQKVLTSQEEASNSFTQNNDQNEGENEDEEEDKGSDVEEESPEGISLLMKEQSNDASALSMTSRKQELQDEEQLKKKIKEKIFEKMYKQKVKQDQEMMEQIQKSKKLKTSPAVSANPHGLSKQPKFLQIQEDYDSQPEEELDITPKWMKDRETVEDNLEDVLDKPPINSINIMRGQTRGKASFFSKVVQSNHEKTGIFKNIIKLKKNVKKETDGQFKKYLDIKQLVVRLYVLRGKSLTPKDDRTSDPYLKIKLGSTVITDKESLRPKTCNPGFYTSYDIPTTLPGAATLEIQCWDDDGFSFPDFIGSTCIDVENRFFSKDWKLKYPNKMPIEERTLFIPQSAAPQGVLECWLEILDRKEAALNPRIDNSPPPKEEYELRVVVWSTKDVVFKDETTKCNDLYVVGILGDKKLETDTHWRCRAKGSFNWRYKFPMTLPLDNDDDYGKDILTLQMWDRDITVANDMIGEVQIPLNGDSFRMLEKAYKRKQSMKMKKLNTKTKQTVDKFWVAITHPEALDEKENYIPQGYCEISIEILPKAFADEIPNGQGRDAPNQSPVLPEPVGRFSFDIMSPWKMFREILGPDLARKICCLVFCSVFCVFAIYWMFFFAGNIIAVVIGKYV